MCERVKAIEKYYTDLEYDRNRKQKALMKISTLSEEIKFESCVNEFSTRFLETTSVLKENLSVFQSVCEHVDAVTAIIQRLDYYGFLLYKDISNREAYKYFMIVLDVLCTVFNICTQHEMQLFLHAAIIKDSYLEDSINYKIISENNYKNLLSYQTIEIIVLKDSDVYAAIKQLKLTGIRFNKIWVQEPVKEKFLSLLRIYFKRSFKRLIHIFRTKEELFTLNKLDKISIVSIWSEDITAAKNLTVSLNKNILFINTHMDFCDSTVILPYTRLFYGPPKKYLLNCSFECDLNIDTNDKNKNAALLNDKNTFRCNLFYDGMWQMPAKDLYWTDVKEIQCANATIEDSLKCIDSAEKGFKIWSTWSNDARKQALAKFAHILKYNGKSTLSDLILSWINKYCADDFGRLCPQIGTVEVTTICEPRGLVILQKDEEIEIFYELIHSLLTGNSVIVLYSRDSCSLAPYCDMFSTCKIPSGVINMLLGENIQYFNLEYKSMHNPNDITAYISTFKYIIFPFK